jgi:phospholipase/carboxylesterase
MLLTCDDIPGPHSGQPVVRAGRRLPEAAAAMVLVHGRGATAEGMLSLASELDWPQLAFLAPQAADFSWYPQSFRAPVEDNEPWLSSALAMLDCTLEHVESAGIPLARTILLGFSQGACLTLELVARQPRRFGAVVAWSGALIDRQPPADSLEETPIFIGCSDRDPHVPVELVRASAEAFRHGGGRVTERIYPGLGHTVNQDELNALQVLMEEVVEGVKA